MTRTLTTLSHAMIIVGLGLFCVSAKSQDQRDRQFVVSEAVAATLDNLTRGYQPNSKISALILTSETTINSNPAKSNFAEAYSTQVLQTNGLWATEFGSKTTGTQTTGRSYSLSLCGLVTVVTSGTAVTAQDGATVLPIGKLFLPFGFRTTTGFTRIARIKSLDTSTLNICSPQPGNEFSYRLESEVSVQSSALFGRTETTASLEEVLCKVSAEERPASQLLVQFRGTSLDVVCEYKIASNPPVQRDFIYLRDSGMYLMVGLREAWGHSKIVYKDVQYAN